MTTVSPSMRQNRIKDRENRLALPRRREMGERWNSGFAKVPAGISRMDKEHREL